MRSRDYKKMMTEPYVYFGLPDQYDEMDDSDDEDYGKSRKNEKKKKQQGKKKNRSLTEKELSPKKTTKPTKKYQQFPLIHYIDSSSFSSSSPPPYTPDIIEDEVKTEIVIDEIPVDSNRDMPEEQENKIEKEVEDNEILRLKYEERETMYKRLIEIGKEKLALKDETIEKLRTEIASLQRELETKRKDVVKRSYNSLKDDNIRTIINNYHNSIKHPLFQNFSPKLPEILMNHIIHNKDFDEIADKVRLPPRIMEFLLCNFVRQISGLIFDSTLQDEQNTGIEVIEISHRLFLQDGQHAHIIFIVNNNNGKILQYRLIKERYPILWNNSHIIVNNSEHRSIIISKMKQEFQIMSNYNHTDLEMAENIYKLIFSFWNVSI